MLGERLAIGFANPVATIDADVEVGHQTVVQAVAPAMHRHRLASPPGFAQDRGVADVDHLLHHVEFAKAIQADLALGDALERRRMVVTDVLHMAQPVVHQPDAVVVVGGGDPPQP